MGPDASGSQPPKLAYHSSGSLSQYSFSRSSSVSVLATDIRSHASTTQDATTIARPTNITIHMALPTERKVESRVTGGSSALNRSSSQFSDGVRKTDRPPGRVPIVIGRRLISKKGADPRHGRVVRADSRDRTPVESSAFGVDEAILCLLAEQTSNPLRPRRRACFVFSCVRKIGRSG